MSCFVSMIGAKIWLAFMISLWNCWSTKTPMSFMWQELFPLLYMKSCVCVVCVYVFVYVCLCVCGVYICVYVCMEWRMCGACGLCVCVWCVWIVLVATVSQSSKYHVILFFLSSALGSQGLLSSPRTLESWNRKWPSYLRCSQVTEQVASGLPSGYLRTGILECLYSKLLVPLINTCSMCLHITSEAT